MGLNNFTAAKALSKKMGPFEFKSYRNVHRIPCVWKMNNAGILHALSNGEHWPKGNTVTQKLKY